MKSRSGKGCASPGGTRTPPISLPRGGRGGQREHATASGVYRQQPLIVVVVLGVLVECNDDAKPQRNAPPPAPPRTSDARVIASELKFVGCAPALAPPGIRGNGQIGHGR